MRSWPAHHYRQFGPKDEREIEAQLCEAEFAGSRFRAGDVPWEVWRSRPDSPRVHQVSPMDQCTALDWFAEQRMVHNVSRLIQAWNLSNLTISGSQRARVVVEAASHCPRLQSLDVWTAGLDREAFIRLLCADHITCWRLRRCWFESAAGGATPGWLAGCSGSRLSRLVVAGDPGSSSLADVVTELVGISPLISLRLNLRFARGQLDGLLDALSTRTESELMMLEIRVGGLRAVEALLEALAKSPCRQSLEHLVVHCKKGPFAASLGEVPRLLQELVRVSCRLHANNVEFRS